MGRVWFHAGGDFYLIEIIRELVRITTGERPPDDEPLEETLRKLREHPEPSP